MKHFLPLILLLILTGCCRVAEQPLRLVESKSTSSSTLYRFRLEHSAITQFSGLLALKPREDGMWSALLDATGVPLVKMIIYADGTKQVEYCAEALRDSRLPELLGKLVEYIYFTPANVDCPWYVFSCVCMAKDSSEESMVKWERFGPIRLWEVEQVPPEMKKITVHMNLSSITVHLQRIDNESGK